ncbi:MAG: ATP synthase F0 subunit B [Oscillospiraceae bacterium]|nr:ATP synthase F0 subunit B [Oscillospiraceae bacterium]
MTWNWDRDYRDDSAAPAQGADAGMDDFLASAKKLTDRFLEQSRSQADKILQDADAKAAQIVENARQKADGLVREAEQRAGEITQQANQEADAILKQARAEAESLREPGTIDQEYAVQCVSDCFEELRRRQEESMDVLNAQWQKFLIGLMPDDETPELRSAPAPAPDEADAAPAAEIPYDLEEKVSALSREMDELYRNRMN